MASICASRAAGVPWVTLLWYRASLTRFAPEGRNRLVVRSPGLSDEGAPMSRSSAACPHCNERLNIGTRGLFLDAHERPVAQWRRAAWKTCSTCSTLAGRHVFLPWPSAFGIEGTRTLNGEELPENNCSLHRNHGEGENHDFDRRECSANGVVAPGARRRTASASSSNPPPGTATAGRRGRRALDGGRHQGPPPRPRRDAPRRGGAAKAGRARSPRTLASDQAGVLGPPAARRELEVRRLRR